jgi:hypothetical protein
MFSSPTNYYLGYATGTATNNNTETIILRAPWVASIMPQPIYTVPLAINGTGTVTQNGVAGATVINPTACVVSRGQSINLMATGNFLCWTGATNTTASNITLCPSQDTNLAANFVGVTSLAPQISLQPQGQSINQGNTLTLQTAAVGVPTPDFQWQFNGTNIGAGSTLTISNITIASQGSYQCVLSNTAGSITSCVAAVVVDQPLRITQNRTEPEAQTIVPMCNGDMGFLYFGPAGRTYQIQASADLIQWDIVGTNTTTAEINLFIDTNASQYPSRFYRVKVVQ